jgi:nicotinate-nucleotide--dimethylbenzimidazole phosphoribosyltransferase
MSQNPTATNRFADLPVESVLFEPSTIVDPPSPEDGVAPRPTPGARRLARALTLAGVRAHVLAPRHSGSGPRDDNEAEALRDHLVAAGFGPDVLTAISPTDATTGTSPARTLVVSRCPEKAAGMAAAGHATVTLDERSVHRAVLAWMATRIGTFAAASALCPPVDDDATDATRVHHLRLTKPPGSLGQLEAIGAQLAGIAAETPPPLPRPAATAVFAGDHGVHAQGVTPWPQEVTTQMVANFLAGGAAVNVLARQAGSEVVVVDVGVAGDIPAPRVSGTELASRLIDRNVRRGTADLATGPAMSVDEAHRALDAGAEVAAMLVDGGARCLVTGDMGIGNTTPSAALIASLTDRPAASVTGRGAGIDDQLLTRKTAVVAAAAARARYQHGNDVVAVLAEVGGLEHAALAGFVVGAAALQVPLVVDGLIAASALLVASRLVPGVERCVIAGHRSVEPGASAVLDELGLDPMIDLGLRLGEGTGAVLALPLVEAAALVLHEMATFDQAGVTDKG